MAPHMNFILTFYGVAVPRKQFTYVHLGSFGSLTFTIFTLLQLFSIGSPAAVNNIFIGEPLRNNLKGFGSLPFTKGIDYTYIGAAIEGSYFNILSLAAHENYYTLLFTISIITFGSLRFAPFTRPFSSRSNEELNISFPWRCCDHWIIFNYRVGLFLLRTLRMASESNAMSHWPTYESSTIVYIQVYSNFNSTCNEGFLYFRLLCFTKLHVP